MKNDLLNKNLDNIPKYGLFEVDRLRMKDRIGFLPISIWEPDWNITKQLKGIIGDSGQSREWTKSSQNFRSIGWSGKDKPQKISIFNPHLAQMILSAYCPKEAKIYDPFGGGGTRGFIAAAMGHRYYGIEIRKEEVDRLIQQRKELKKKFHITLGDSKFYEFKDDFFDFSYTCPPYYNLEIYSELEGDISNAKTYDDFLTMLFMSMKGVYKGLKKGCLSVWVVGNFRDKIGNLVHFNGDIIRLGKKCGFQLHDELIFWGASKSAVQRSGQFEANRKSVRVHEYIIIFKK